MLAWEGHTKLEKHGGRAMREVWKRGHGNGGMEGGMEGDMKVRMTCSFPAEVTL
jgi:hypothetical protein